ncbi:MAG TPA: hypothetical protein VFP72_24790 [Kineosporiaceae bacterium]|nr:hypothetical protein [Kineosporiaceae bacterium]
MRRLLAQRVIDEEIAPQRFRNNPLARELIAVMLQRSTRNPDGRELRNLAHRVGISA